VPIQLALSLHFCLIYSLLNSSDRKCKAKNVFFNKLSMQKAVMCIQEGVENLLRDAQHIVYQQAIKILLQHGKRNTTSIGAAATAAP